MKFVLEILKSANEAYNRALSRLASFINSRTGQKCSDDTLKRTINCVLICATTFLMRKHPVFMGNLIGVGAILLMTVGLMTSLTDDLFAMAFEDRVTTTTAMNTAS